MHWPVPATDEDVQKIPQGTFRKLPGGAAKMRGFTHTLEKRADGRCTFLADDNRCSLHADKGIDAKPGMCQLFPYSFTPTPSGTYLYVSFASTGVLENFGTPLTEQRADMEAQLQLFAKLFPAVDADWSTAQLIDGVPLSWEQYLALEEAILDCLKTNNVVDGLIQSSRLVQKSLPSPASADRLPPVEAAPKDVDKLILNALWSLYFPQDVFSEQTFDIDARSLMNSLVHPPSNITIFGGNGAGVFLNTNLGTLDEKSENLLARFVYTRIFGKLFFGRSYAHLSLLAGLHHLFFVVALIRMQLKLRAGAGKPVEFWDVAELLRTCERRMTQMDFSRESSAILEVLLASPARLERLKNLCW
jgi:hypothetical protein